MGVSTPVDPALAKPFPWDVGFRFGNTKPVSYTHLTLPTTPYV